ncbi:hypothetical protein [Streptomyces sp. NPDC050988]|uniref:hypothetical protein n=1 Tax=Streptomyces sp. NPDC050988 TaxID=3365637 RepID=UPI0037B20A9C
MSTATFTPAPVSPGAPPGATALHGSHRHRLGDTLRAIKVFATAAMGVILLGEYEEEAGVRRR